MVSNYKQLSALATIVLTALVSGCSTTLDSSASPHFSSVRPVDTRPLPIDTGSIYKSGYDIKLFEDFKAKTVGDILTVVLAEKTNASKKATTKTKKESDIGIAAPLILGRGITHDGVALMQTEVEADREFKGEGDSTQSNSLSGTVSVTVAEVLSNGNLVIRGEKLITLNDGVEHIRVSGIVRPQDITPQNTVSSSQIASAQIIYGGEGVLADANKKGWLLRVIDSAWWPF